MANIFNSGEILTHDNLNKLIDLVNEKTKSSIRTYSKNMSMNINDLNKIVNVINLFTGQSFSLYEIGDIVYAYKLLELYDAIKEYVESSILCFTAEEDSSSITLDSINSSGSIQSTWENTGMTVYYSFDNITWNTWNGLDVISLNKNEKIYVYGDNSTSWISNNKYPHFSMSGKIAASGNIMSLINIHCPYTIPFNSAFSYMFCGCSSLTTPPDLSATILTNNCYMCMFDSCTGLTKDTSLPATTLTQLCYYGMFAGCSSITTASDLPATTLTSMCYFAMYNECSGLINAPKLPATTLTYNCYWGMFAGCTSLVTAPELPATTLALDCYKSLFYGCTSLITAPELPATTLNPSCYSHMFYGCTSLINAPELPATTLSSSSYEFMFYGCTSLINPPSILPATKLIAYCYWYMFTGCTSLVIAPELPALELAGGCYQHMFADCSSLNYVKAMFTTDPNSTTATAYWLSNVSSSGTFVKNPDATWALAGNWGIPEGWTTIYGYNYLESSGTQYIDTGFTPDINSGFDLNFAYTTWSNTDLFGAGGSWNTGFGLHTHSDGYKIGFTCGKDLGDCSTVNFYKDVNIFHNIKYINKVAYVDDTIITTADPITPTVNETLCIFRNYKSNYQKIKVKQLKIYDNNTLVRNLQPCKYNDEAGLWDSVKNKFYGNSGTGTFTIG